MQYKNLRQGAVFVFERGGPVFVRCRGGFRPGCGGPLYTPENPAVRVFIYAPAYLTNNEEI